MYYKANLPKKESTKRSRTDLTIKGKSGALNS